MVRALEQRVISLIVMLDHAISGGTYRLSPIISVHVSFATIDRACESGWEGSDVDWLATCLTSVFPYAWIGWRPRVTSVFLNNGVSNIFFCTAPASQLHRWLRSLHSALFSYDAGWLF